jgi:Cu(I)/Ag(I) efflux system protein CusF
MKVLYSCILALAMILPLASHASSEQESAPGESPADTAAAETLTEGEVKRINKETGKLTIKHGPILNLDMPPMTMVFRTADSAMLDQVQIGDQVRFIVEKIDGKYTVTHIEPVQ